MDSATSYMAAKNTMYFYSPPGKVPPLLHAYPQYQYLPVPIYTPG